MASRFPLDHDLNQVLIETKPWVRKIIFNRPQQLNCLTYEMISQLKRALEKFEVDDAVRLVIIKGNGKAFCSGGDVVALIQSILIGHWSYGASLYNKLLVLCYVVATYKKPLVLLMDGIVMGGGAGLSINGKIRVVTENTVFAMPEAGIGNIPDVGASYFLSRLPGRFGEYLGLTGAKISGVEMFECGLATHFVLSKDLKLLEDELCNVVCIDASAIPVVLKKVGRKPNLNSKTTDLNYARLDIINKLFSKETVEDILSSLETEAMKGTEDEWIVKVINSMKSASPTSLKIFLKSVREGKRLRLEECLNRDYIVCRHFGRRSFHNDFFEGIRAMLIDKDKTPKWEPSKLEQVSEEMVNKFFKDIEEDDDDWNSLQLPDRNRLVITSSANSKL